MCIVKSVGLRQDNQGSDVRLVRILLNFWLKERNLWQLEIESKVDAKFLNSLQLFLIEAANRYSCTVIRPDPPAKYAFAMDKLRKSTSLQFDISKTDVADVEVILRLQQASIFDSEPQRMTTPLIDRSSPVRTRSATSISNSLKPDGTEISYLGQFLPKITNDVPIDDDVIHAIYAENEKKSIQTFSPYFRALFSDATFSINTPLRIAHFLGQVGAETGGLSSFSEKGGAAYLAMYDPPGRKATNLGNTEVGDGARFRGRGFIQMTGRDNYTRFQRWMIANVRAIDLLSSNEKAATLATNYELARYSAGWYWTRCFGTSANIHADNDDVEQVSYFVNRGWNGITERRAFTRRARFVVR
jgi:predicted chitinase